jgi:hypothetical protein
MVAWAEDALPAAGIFSIRRTDTTVQCSDASATNTWDWTRPQPLTGTRGISRWPVASVSTISGGSTASAGQTVPGVRDPVGRRSALTSGVSPLSDRWSVAVTHCPLPGTACEPVTQRSTLTGTKETGSVALGVPVGQPEHAGSPAATGPPLTVGTGAGAGDPVPAADPAPFVAADLGAEEVPDAGVLW